MKLNRYAAVCGIVPLLELTYTIIRQGTFIRKKNGYMSDVAEREEEVMEERRKIDRVDYPVNGVIVICDTQEKIYVHTENVSPLGMAFRMEAGSSDIVGKDIIIVAEALIMYADVNRQDEQEDGSYIVGISARKFTEDVLQYLFNNIALREED